MNEPSTERFPVEQTTQWLYDVGADTGLLLHLINCQLLRRLTREGTLPIEHAHF